jgi:hypothetical protein
MPKPNYGFEKRQRELEKKRKKADKAQKKAAGPLDTDTNSDPAAPAPSEEQAPPPALK